MSKNQHGVEMYVSDSLGNKHTFSAKCEQRGGRFVPTEDTVVDYFKACKEAAIAEAKACPIKIPYELWNDTKRSFVESATE